METNWARHQQELQAARDKESHTYHRLETIPPPAVAALLATDALHLNVNYPAASIPLRRDDENDDEMASMGDTGYRHITGQLILLKPSGPDVLHLPAARCEAFLVSTIAPFTFYSDMDSISQGCVDMARAVFDEHGALRPEFCNPAPAQGTTVWRSGLGLYNLLLIDEIQVAPTCQRQGIGTRLLQALSQKVIKEWPAY